MAQKLEKSDQVVFGTVFSTFVVYTRTIVLFTSVLVKVVDICLHFSD